MSIKATASVENPGNVLVTLKLTMTVRELRDLSNQLNVSYPSWAVASIIRQALSQVETNVLLDEKPVTP